MIIVFGAVCKDIVMHTDHFPQDGEMIHAIKHTVSYGGKGANQALAAARSGAKTALVGQAGNDEYTEELLRRIRHDGVITSGVGKSDRPIGTRLYMEDSQGHRRTIISAGANADASASQIPEDIVNEKTFILLQTEISAAENIKVLEMAKARGATTILNLSPFLDMSKKSLGLLDYLVVNQEEARQLADKTGVTIENDALKLAQGLSKQGNFTCIITLGIRGSIAHTPEGVSWSVAALPVENIVDRTGAQDAYCGTLAACLEAGIPLARSLKRASIAASLACTKKGGQESFPYLDDIDKHINDVGDPAKM